MGGTNQRDEFTIIAKYFAPLTGGAGEAYGLTDDAALLDVPPGQQLVMTKDMMVAGVHFFADDAPDLIARKLLRVNISDLAGMGATPLAYMLGFGVTPDIDEGWIKQFAHGLAQDQQEFGLALMGGDSVATPHDMTFSLTAYGLVPQDTALTRAGAQIGDDIYVTGTIGDGALGLLAAQGQLSDPDGYLAGRYHLPQPRIDVGAALSGVAHGALDVSDGLVSDLGHMAKASDLGIWVNAVDVPLSSAARSVLGNDPALLNVVLTGGDDYELVFAAPRDAVDDIAQIAAQTGVAISRIGHCAQGEGVEIVSSDGQPLVFAQEGYNHFR